MNTEKHNRSCVAGKKFSFTGALRRLRVVVFFFSLWFCASISDLSGDPKQSWWNLHMYSREIMLMKEKQQKRTLSWRSIPLSPRLKTHSFVKYLTHLCLSFEPGDLRSTSYQLVWEKCPPSPFDTGTDNLAHLQKARQLRACESEHGFHCFVLLATPLFVQHHSFFFKRRLMAPY